MYIIYFSLPLVKTNFLPLSVSRLLFLKLYLSYQDDCFAIASARVPKLIGLVSRWNRMIANPLEWR